MHLFPRKPAQRLAFPNPESSHIAAVDLWVQLHMCPPGWNDEKKRKIIRDLRQGKTSRVIAREQNVNRDDVAKCARYIEQTGAMSRALLSDNSGVAAVETALVFPFLAFLILGGLDLAVATAYHGRMQFAAEGAARCMAIKQCPSEAVAITYANEQANLPGAVFTAAVAPCGVSVGGNYTFTLIELFPSIPLSVSACYPKEST